MWTSLSLCFYKASFGNQQHVFFYIFSYTGQRRTKLLRVLISPSIIKVSLKSRMTRCWSAPAGCTSTNSPSTLRAATCPSSLSFTLVIVAWAENINIMRKTYHYISIYMCVYFLSSCSISHLSQRHPSPGERQLFRGHGVVSWGDEDPVRMAVHQHESYCQKRHWSRGPRHHRLHCMFN